MIAIVLGGLVGLLAGLVAEPVVRRLPARSEESLEQAGWTRALCRPPALQLLGCLLGVACGHWLEGTALVVGLALVALLVPIIAIDLQWRIIPDLIVLPGTLVGLGLGIALDPSRSVELVAGAGIGFLAFLLMALAAPGGMGIGDVKLALMLGAFLGWAVLPALVVAFLLGALPSIVIIAVRGLRKGRRTGLPFGPFLAAGGIIGMLWGPALIDAYLRGSGV